jgi:hypothetical protein
MREFKEFGQVKAGEVFQFAAEEEFPGMARGPFVKTGKRSYQYPSDAMNAHYGTMRVGTLKAEVYTVETIDNDNDCD